MLSILANRTFRHLFAAQVVALVGTGLMTVALALLAFELAGDAAARVLGTALAIKMICYVGIAPLAGSLAGRVPRRAFLVGLDVVRLAVAAALPFVDAVWQVYVLIAILQSASAAFTPTFQATIPDILTDERDYTRALSLSRLAYDLENLLSPTLAAVLIGFVGFHFLFVGTAIGFMVSALLILSVVLPRVTAAQSSASWRPMLTRGVRIYFATPRLRGLLAIHFAVAAAGAMVIVNTVVLVRSVLGRGDADVAIAMAVFGAGSMVAALALPRLLDRLGDRPVMLPAAAALPVLLLGCAAFGWAGFDSRDWSVVLVAWGALGLFYSTAQLPTGRLLRRSARDADRPALYAAQFSLSHACWLVTYPLAGWLGSTVGLPVVMAVLGSLAALATLLAVRLWPATDREVLVHRHPDLPDDHPHLAGAGASHAHPYVIDDLHRHWPIPAR